MSVSRFLAGFIVGGAIGAVAGVLLAPRSGEETRKILKDTAEDMARRADETAKQIKVKADDAVSDLQKRGDEIKEKLQDLIAKQKEGKTETEEEHKEESAE
jgi:gas vesicle protein